MFWNSHHFGQFFRLGRDAVSRFFESLQRTKVKIRCCTVLRVLQWLAGVYVEGFYYFLTNLRASNAYITDFIEGGKVALVKEPFCVPLLPTADELNCFYLFHVTYEFCKDLFKLLPA